MFIVINKRKIVYIQNLNPASWNYHILILSLDIHKYNSIRFHKCFIDPPNIKCLESCWNPIKEFSELPKDCWCYSDPDMAATRINLVSLPWCFNLPINFRRLQQIFSLIKIKKLILSLKDEMWEKYSFKKAKLKYIRVYIKIIFVVNNESLNDILF